MISQKIAAIVARRQQRRPPPERRALARLEPDGIDHRPLAHRLDDAARTEHGQSADDAHSRVERSLRQLRASGNANHHLQPRVQLRPRAHGADRRADHPPRHRIDCRAADRLVESRQRHAADALAAFNLYARRPAKRHVRPDLDAVGDVGIVAGILPNRAARRTGTPGTPHDGDAHAPARRHAQLNRVRRLAHQQQFRRRSGRSRRATSGRHAAAKPPAVNRHISVHSISPPSAPNKKRQGRLRRSSKRPCRIRECARPSAARLHALRGAHRS